MADRGRALVRGLARRRATAVIAAFVLLLLPGASRGVPVALAAATCASPTSLEAALTRGDIVFVGSVVFLENDDRWATVQVEERWRGADDLGETVTVHGAGDVGTTTPNDRSYEPGTRYVFAVRNGTDFLVDDACSATQPWADSLAGLRPDGVQPFPGLAVASPIGDVDMAVLLPMVALVAALIVGVVAYLIVLRSRRRPPDWMR